MLLQPALDDWLVRIELALSPGFEALGVGLLARPLWYRLFIGFNPRSIWAKLKRRPLFF